MSVNINQSRTGFRLVLTSMTLNGLHGIIALILCFFSPNSIALQSDYVTVVEDRSIMSSKYCLPVPVFHFLAKTSALYSAVSLR